MKADFYQVVGKEIKKFVLQKWGTQRKAAEVLGVSEHKLGKSIKGLVELDPKLQLALKRYGFDQIHLEKWYNVQEINPDTLSKSELMELVLAQKTHMRQQSELIDTLAHLNSNLQSKIDLVLNSFDRVSKRMLNNDSSE